MKGDTDANRSWDFRSERELELARQYLKTGYVIEQGDKFFLKKITDDVLIGLSKFLQEKSSAPTNDLQLHEIHQWVANESSNDLRLFLLKHINEQINIKKCYFNAAKELIYKLCGNELAMQKNIGLSINLPSNQLDVLPVHADTWNGVSPYELNIWIPLVDCTRSKCLYILEKHKYLELVEQEPHLLRLSSDELYKKLEPYLKWIKINFGEILAFDQSLPHGFALNQESTTHWSLNCRFKGLHTPYWDKKLGEYFMPITVKSCTRVGINYQHPSEWL